VSPAVRILFLADSHLGFDLPIRPRVARRRRGHDFLANYAAALEPAKNGEVDLVVHGGDVFDRPGAIASLAFQAFQPLVEIAEAGIPVLVVPGNHERSELPHLRLARHPNIHVFDCPRTFVRTVRGVRLAMVGFPYHRRDVRSRFRSLIAETRWQEEEADLRLLCLHHCVEGATVGPGDYVFRGAPDVIRPGEVPPSFAAVLSGHIHRHQVLTRGLDGARLAAPVLYPGSLERTSLAEIGEPKGHLILTLDPSASPVVRWEFRALPARPMVRLEIAGAELLPADLDRAIRGAVAAGPEDAVLSIRVSGPLTAGHWAVMSSGHLRRYVPATMNVEVRPAGGLDRGALAGRRGGDRGVPNEAPAARSPATRGDSRRGGRRPGGRGALDPDQGPVDGRPLGAQAPGVLPRGAPRSPTGIATSPVSIGGPPENS